MPDLHPYPPGSVDHPGEPKPPESGGGQSGTAPAFKLVFMVGLWRSGTSLLHALLNHHPEIALMYEAELLDLWPDGTGMGSGDWPQRLEFYNQTLTRHQIRAETLTQPQPGPEAAIQLYRQFGLSRGATVLGEKSPAYHSRLSNLAARFPEAYFLIIWRDPIACCHSAARAANGNRFFAQRGMATRILFGAEVLARGVESLLRRKRRVHEVVYDELVKNPEAELRRICDFIQVPFLPEMLDLKHADVSSLPPGEHHSKVRSGVIKQGDRAENPVSARITGKAKRYAVLWRERFAALGFARVLVAEPGMAGPGMAERLVDGAAYRFWRAVDRLKYALFRHLPLGAWAWLRGATPRGRGKQRLGEAHVRSGSGR